MTLPASSADLQWPPPEWGRIFGRYREHAAWYSGSPNELASVYYAAANQPQGYWRTNYDRFWARSPAPQTRLMLHEPIASALCSVNSDLLFAEPPDFIIDPDAKSADDVQKRLDELLQRNSAVRSFAELAETVPALGGGFTRVLWDKNFEPDFPMLDIVDADCALPEFRMGRLVAVTFFEEVQREDEEVWRYLERHEVGTIETALYHGTSERLGNIVPLDSISGMQFSESVDTEIDLLTAAYVPNVRPNRVFRRSRLGKYLGRSDFDGVEAELDALDEASTSLMRDLRLARARLIVPEEFLESRGKGKGTKFDIDQEVWEGAPIDMPGFSADKLITPSQFAIRAADHLQVIKSKLETIVAAAGYSSATFGIEMPASVPQTATQIVNRERQSFLTRSKKILYWTPALEEILHVLLAVDVAQGFADHPVYRPRVEFADSIRDDPQQNASIVHVLRSAEAASAEIRVRMVHPKWKDSEVDAEVEKILRELSAKNAPASPPPEEGSTAASPIAQTTAGGMSEQEKQQSGNGEMQPAGVAPSEMAASQKS